MNHGLIFKGPGIVYDFSASWENSNRIIDYTSRFGFSYLEDKKIGGGNINFIPIKLTYLFKPSEVAKFVIGPQFLAEYNYELYPDFQSGYSFWFTHFSLGASSRYRFNLNRHLFRLSLESTIAGFTSRTAEYDNPYFFDLSFRYAVQYLHQDIGFGSLNKYNHSEFEIRWQPKAESKIAVAYNIQYYGYYEEPQITMINQMIKLVFLPKTSKK